MSSSSIENKIQGLLVKLRTENTSRERDPPPGVMDPPLNTPPRHRPPLDLGLGAVNRRPLNLSFTQRNVETETDTKLREIMKISGVLTIGGVRYPTKITDMEHMSVLGNGTCGVVVKMRHTPSGAIIAVKQMRRSGNSEENKRIIMDIDVVLKSHDCPYIVQCLGCFITESDVWICMELMATCFDKLLKNLKMAIPENVLGKVTYATVKALSYLKEQHDVIHRDVKPSNILVDEKGNVKLCDFGISGRLVDSMAQTRSAGCAAYMAPERIEPPNPMKPDYDIRADVWSLGITLVELATGVFPYRDCKTDFEVLTKVLSEDPPSLPKDEDFTHEFRAFVACCLIKNYLDRPKYIKLLEQPFLRKHAVCSNVLVDEWFENALKQAEQLGANSPARRYTPAPSNPNRHISLHQRFINDSLSNGGPPQASQPPERVSNPALPPDGRNNFSPRHSSLQGKATTHSSIPIPNYQRDPSYNQRSPDKRSNPFTSDANGRFSPFQRKLGESPPPDGGGGKVHTSDTQNKLSGTFQQATEPSNVLSSPYMQRRNHLDGYNSYQRNLEEINTTDTLGSFQQVTEPSNTLSSPYMQRRNPLEGYNSFQRNLEETGAKINTSDTLGSFQQATEPPNALSSPYLQRRNHLDSYNSGGAKINTSDTQTKLMSTEPPNALSPYLQRRNHLDSYNLLAGKINTPPISEPMALSTPNLPRRNNNSDGYGSALGAKINNSDPLIGAFQPISDPAILSTPNLPRRNNISDGYGSVLAAKVNNSDPLIGAFQPTLDPAILSTPNLPRRNNISDGYGLALGAKINNSDPLIGPFQPTLDPAILSTPNLPRRNNISDGYGSALGTKINNSDVYNPILEPTILSTPNLQRRNQISDGYNSFKPEIVGAKLNSSDPLLGTFQPISDPTILSTANLQRRNQISDGFRPRNQIPEPQNKLIGILQQATEQQRRNQITDKIYDGYSSFRRPEDSPPLDQKIPENVLLSPYQSRRSYIPEKTADGYCSPVPLRKHFHMPVAEQQYCHNNTSPIMLQRFFHQQKQLQAQQDEAKDDASGGKKRFASHIKLQLVGDRSSLRSSRHQSPEPPPRLSRGSSTESSHYANNQSPLALRRNFLDASSAASPSFQRRYISPSPPQPPPRRLSESSSVPGSPQHFRARFHYTPEPQRRIYRNNDIS